MNEPIPVKPKKVSESSWNKFMEVYNISKELNDPFPIVTATQLALESAWFTKPSGANNFGGQKAKKGEDSTSITTHEDTAFGTIKINAEFKNYNSLRESLEDRSEKWFKVYKDAKNPTEAVQLLKQANYATDKKYEQKLGSMFSSVGIIPEEVKSNYQEPVTQNTRYNRGTFSPLDVEIDNTYVAPTFDNFELDKDMYAEDPSGTSPEEFIDSQEEQPAEIGVNNPQNNIQQSPKPLNYLDVVGDYITNAYQLEQQQLQEQPQSQPTNSFTENFAKGGSLFTEFNTGGSHSENPLGGIPQGGNNRVQEGETKHEDYIFSNILKL